MLKNKFLSFIILAIATYSASFIGGIATYAYKEPWYSNLIKSGLNPPDWVFAPVWTTLYIMMALAIWKIWINSFDLKTLQLYFIHLFFNGTWSIVFFGLHQIAFALINLFIILIFIVLLMNKYLILDSKLIINTFKISIAVILMTLGCYFLNLIIFANIEDSSLLLKVGNLFLILVCCNILYLGMIFMLKVLTIQDLKRYIQK